MDDTAGPGPDLHDVQRLATTGAAWLVGAAQKAVALFRGVLIGAALLWFAAVVLGVLIADTARVEWSIVFVLVFSVPTLLAWWVHASTSTVATKGPQLVTDLTRAARDPAVRDSIAVALGREPSATSAADARPPVRGWRRLRQRRTDVVSLRKLVWGTRGDMIELWGAVVSLARVPWSLMVIGIGGAITAVWCLWCLLILLLQALL